MVNYSHGTKHCPLTQEVLMRPFLSQCEEVKHAANA